LNICYTNRYNIFDDLLQLDKKTDEEKESMRENIMENYVTDQQDMNPLYIGIRKNCTQLEEILIFKELQEKKSSNPPSDEEKKQGGGSTDHHSFDNLLHSTLLSLFRHFENQYPSAFKLLEMKSPKPILMPELLKLLQITNMIKTTNKYGIYRFDNVSKKLLAFINSQFINTKDFIGKITGISNKLKVYEELSELPEVDISPDMTQEEETPCRIQFFIVAHNLILPSSYIGSDVELYDDIVHFFKKNTLFMSYSQTADLSTNIPLNTYEINFRNGVVQDLSYFNNHHQLHLHNITKFKKYMTYNNLELAVSIFIGLKEMMTK
jgi:hypothetical protein